MSDGLDHGSGSRMAIGRDDDTDGTAAMNAAFIGLAFLAALNPKLFAVDLLLVENARARLMFACFLLGGMGMSLAVGLLDVLVLQADAVSTQGSVSAGLDLTLGIPLLAIGVLVATGRLHGRRKAPPARPARAMSPHCTSWSPGRRQPRRRSSRSSYSSSSSSRWCSSHSRSCSSGPRAPRPACCAPTTG